MGASSGSGALPAPCAAGKTGFAGASGSFWLTAAWRVPAVCNLRATSPSFSAAAARPGGFRPAALTWQSCP